MSQEEYTTPRIMSYEKPSLAASKRQVKVNISQILKERGSVPDLTAKLRERSMVSCSPQPVSNRSIDEDSKRDTLLVNG